MYDECNLRILDAAALRWGHVRGSWCAHARGYVEIIDRDVLMLGACSGFGTPTRLQPSCWERVRVSGAPARLSALMLGACSGSGGSDTPAGARENRENQRS